MNRPPEETAWHWGWSISGLRLGLRVGRRLAGRGMDVVAALLNESPTLRQVQGNFRLQIASSGGPPEVIMGPRSTDSVALIPGEEVEFAIWRLSDETFEPGRYVVSVTYEAAGLQPIDSGTLDVSIGHLTVFKDSL